MRRVGADRRARFGGAGVGAVDPLIRRSLAGDGAQEELRALFATAEAPLGDPLGAVLWREAGAASGGSRPAQRNAGPSRRNGGLPGPAAPAAGPLTARPRLDILRGFCKA